MRTNYNDSSGRNGRYPKRQNGSNNGGARRTSGRRTSGGSSGNGSANVAGMSAKRNKYLDMAKEALSNGNRVEAENYYQHAEHYSKMLSAAATTKREREYNSDSTNNSHHNGSVQQEGASSEDALNSQVAVPATPESAPQTQPDTK